MSSEKTKIFSQRLRKARELRKMSQADISERTGLQPSAISHFETGRRMPSFDNLKRLADALNVTTDYLLGRAEEPTVTGPIIDKIYRHVSNLSQSDLQILAEMADLLSKKKKESQHE